MAEIVVPGPTEVFTTRSVVVRITGHPVFESKSRIFRTMRVFSPFFSYVQKSLSHQATHEHWKEKYTSFKSSRKLF